MRLDVRVSGCPSQRGCVVPPQSRLTCGISNGMLHTMRTTTDAAGRLVIPKEIRREAGLKPGMVLEVHWRDGHIEIEPAPLPACWSPSRRSR